MISVLKVEEQLHRIGFKVRGWGKGEIREMSNILADDEIILQCANGYYENGFAMLVATDQRLILVDKKPMFVTIEAIWYDKIGQLNYNHRLLNSSIDISSPNKDIVFTSMNQARLRQILAFAQERMMAARSGNNSYAPPIRPQPQNNFYSAVQYEAPSSPIHDLSTQPLDDDLISTLKETPGVRSSYPTSSLPFTRHRYFSKRPSIDVN